MMKPPSLPSVHQNTRLAILFHRFGPYHLSRLKAVAKLTDLVAIEFSAVDKAYAWDKVKNVGAFNQITLFNDTDIDNKSAREVEVRITEELAKIQPQVVAIPGWSERAALAALNWCVATGTPAILMGDSHGKVYRRVWWKETVKRRIVPLFRSALVAGQRSVDYVISLGMPRERIFTGYDVVDNQHFINGAESSRQKADIVREQLGLPRDYFLTISRFVTKPPDRKNLNTFIQAYARYHQRAGTRVWKLVLVGDGPLKSKILHLRDQLNLGDALVLPGFLQYGELPAYYGLANAFILASISETWGLVVNEAMAAGLPVIVSERCGCAPDLVANGRNGFTFNPFDVDALEELMFKVASDECDCKVMGQASHEIISHWSPEIFANNLLQAARIALDAPPPKVSLLNRLLLWALIHR